MQVPMRTIKSYTVRKGRMTEGQKRAFELLFPRYASLQEQKIPFANLFPKQQDLVVEIGFGMGATLIHHAKMYPHLNFIGIEVHPPGIGCTLNLIEQEQLENVRLIQGDAVLVLKEQCSDNSLSRINIFFPDPWHKKRHHKRRLIQANFIELLTQKLKVGGILHLATDWQNYAEHMLEVLSQNPKLKNLSETYSDRNDRPLTKFEQRGINLGHSVFDLQFTRVL